VNNFDDGGRRGFGMPGHDRIDDALVPQQYRLAILPLDRRT
jgi:hypothetical protein